MIPVFILDHASQARPAVEAVDEAELVGIRAGIPEGAVYTFHRFIPHQAVKVDGNEGVVHHISLINSKAENLIGKRLGCYACVVSTVVTQGIELGPILPFLTHHLLAPTYLFF